MADRQFLDMPPAQFLSFHAVFGKIWPTQKLRPPFEVAAPPLGNPGSAAAVA